MNEKEQLINLYHEIYAAMIAKDETELERIHADEFVLIHMTGMHQSKKEYIRAIMDGTLNYYSVAGIRISGCVCVPVIV